VREIQEEQLISCQLTFITIGDIDYNENIGFVLELIKKSDLYFNIGETSTVIMGNCEKIFRLLNKICFEMRSKRFLMNISISNTCGIMQKNCPIVA
jgi:uncharacterized protein YqgV (UPF0045/DUF77 family)